MLVSHPSLQSLGLLFYLGRGEIYFRAGMGAKPSSGFKQLSHKLFMVPNLPLSTYLAHTD